MRNFLIMLILMLVSNTASAQKLNSHGEKMVSKVEVQTMNHRTEELSKGLVYDFSYDTNGNIVRVERKYDDYEERIVRTGNELTRQYFYKKTPEQTTKYEYLLDGSGNIIQKNYYEGLGDPLVTKKVWDFYYRYDDFSGRAMVDSVLYSALYRDIQSGMRDFEFSDGETCPYILKVRRENNGLYYTEYQKNNNYKNTIGSMVEYAVGVVDDTNINLNFLWTGAPCVMEAQNDAFEFIVPEWVNCKSGYLFMQDANYEYVITKDKKGNITKIEQIDQIGKWRGKVRKVFTVTYR